MKSFNQKFSTTSFVFLYSLLTLILYHKPLFSFALENLDYHSFSGITILTELAIMQFLAVFLLFLLLSFLWVIVKPIGIIFLLLNSVGYYFITQYNVTLDRTMMGNVFNTNFSEASELYHPKIILYILLLGVLPSLIIAKIQVYKISKLKRVVTMVLAILFAIILAYLNSKTWLWFDKHAKRIGGLSMPLSYVVNSLRCINSGNKIEIKIPDAHFTNNNKTLVVLVIGESARMANFSLYGYKRHTNPYLEKDDVVTLQNTTSCTTYTTDSIKCMLSHLGSHSRNLYEALPTYLQRHNVNVLWRSNNWGEPKINVAHYEKAGDINSNCDNCKYDEVLLYKLSQNLKKQENNFIVLHQSGSHGPSYHTKYPPQFEKFKPVCTSVDLQKCSPEELLNAYDNTILYTDYFLHQVIKLLQSMKDTSSVMIYISDHGESLGEHNFYLHGVPYSIAPAVQKEIPFIVWTSDKFNKEHPFIKENLRKQSQHSQNNIFHSVMGAFGMAGESYNKDLDIFSK